MSVDVTTTAAGRLREILERESAARLAVKRAKAVRFLSLVQDGVKVTEAWQALAADADVQLLEDEYEAARIDLIVENAVNWAKLDAAVDAPEGQA
jgi:hypothetical protein